MRKLSILILLLLHFFSPFLSEIKADTEYTSHWNQSRGYEPFRYASKEGILIDNTSDSLQSDYYPLPFHSESLILTFRSRNLHGQPESRYEFKDSIGRLRKINNPMWGFFITTETDTILFSLSYKEIETAVESSPALLLNVNETLHPDNLSIIIKDNINPYEGPNLWKIVCNNRKISLYGGDHFLKELYHKDHFPGKITGFGFISGWGGKVLFQDINLAIMNPTDKLFSKEDLLAIDEYFKNSSDPLEGFWTVFDRELEENLLKLGGDYRLACIRKGDDYIFLYIDGAVINKNQWKSGDIKARFSPAGFPGIYNVEWTDSMKETLSHEIKAQLGEGDTFLIQFPYQSSKIRLRKL